MKRTNKGIAQFGWVLVGTLLLFSAFEHLMTQQLYGRTSPNGEPLMEGGIVIALGIVELVLGGWVLWRQFTRRGRSKPI